MPYKTREELYAAQARHRQRNKDNLSAYLSDKNCTDCGISDSRVLEFDHISDNKFKDISRMTGGSTYSWKRILEEISKCEIRCCNCHRIRTLIQFDRNKPS